MRHPNPPRAAPLLNHAFDGPLLFSRPVWPWLVWPPSAALMLPAPGTVWFSPARESWSAGAAGRGARVQLALSSPVIPGSPALLYWRHHPAGGCTHDQSRW
jgi:hypothetical protein